MKSTLELNQSLNKEVTFECEKPVWYIVSDEEGRSDPATREMVVYEKIVEKIVMSEEGTGGIPELEMGARNHVTGICFVVVIVYVMLCVKGYVLIIMNRYCNEYSA